MRYHSSRDTVMMQRSALGPAAIAARRNAFHKINLGLPQRSFVDADMMRRGGSVGALTARSVSALGCLCGPGDPNFLGSLASPGTVKIGPIAARMIQLRKGGMLPKLAMIDALATLQKQGATAITPEMHLQIAAGLQPLTASLSGFLGALGLAPVLATGLTAGTVAGSSVGIGAATAVGIGSGIALGQTVIPIPVVGAVIGALVFEAAHLLQRHVGKAEAAWANQAFYNSLRVMNGRDYDEKQYSEAFKGMMDTGNNIIPGCGPDRHKNPDCFMQPLAATIAKGYLTRTVPLSATTRQVFQNVVTPWLQSGAGGLVNWANLSKEPIQQSMIQAATDRYLAGQAMTRGDMPVYSNQGLKTPTLLQALQPMLQQPMTNTPQVTGAMAPPPSSPARSSYYGPQTGGVVYSQPGSGQAPVPGTQYPTAGMPPAPGVVSTPGGPTYAAPQYGPAPSGGVPVYAPGGGAAPMAVAPGGLAAKIPWGLIAAAGLAVIS